MAACESSEISTVQHRSSTRFQAYLQSLWRQHTVSSCRSDSGDALIVPAAAMHPALLWFERRMGTEHKPNGRSFVRAVNPDAAALFHSIVRAALSIAADYELKMLLAFAGWTVCGRYIGGMLCSDGLFWP